jgi:hypothetical protein
VTQNPVQTLFYNLVSLEQAIRWFGQKESQQQFLISTRAHQINTFDLHRFRYLSSENDPSKADMAEYEAALKNAGCDLAALTYVKK